MSAAQGGTVKERLARIETHVEEITSIKNTLIGIATTFTTMKENHCTPNERKITALCERVKVVRWLLGGSILCVIAALAKVFVGG